MLYGDTPLDPDRDAAGDARRPGPRAPPSSSSASRPTAPGGYGRLIVDEAGLAAIVEARDATPEQRAIRLCNSGLLAADAALLLDLLAGVEPDNAKGEYYLTDVVGLARAAGLHATAITCPEAETLGVNARTDLAAAEAAFQARARAEALANGTTLVDPGHASGSPSTPSSAAT